MSDDTTTPDESPTSSSTAQDDADKGGRRRGAVRKRATIIRVLGITTIVLALVTGLTVVYFFRHFSGNITDLNIDDELTNRPDKVEVSGPKEPLNILVMGSDTREGEGNDIDNESGADASDTTILFHLSADRSRAYGVSIPRDSMVDRPECKNGAVPAADYVMWNDAYTVGGPSCTIQQFEQLTGVYLDHYIVVDFRGFKDMVNAIGGVEVCIPETIDDRKHGIYLEAGTRTIRDKEALSYVRQRYGVGDGSDIGRMKRQQAFIASMASKVVSAGTLANPVKLVKFLDAATKSLSVDDGLTDLAKIADLGLQFRDIGLDKIQFITIPWEWDPDDPNRVVWAPEADQVWKKLAHDEPLTRALTVDAISAAKPRNSASPSGSSSSSGASSPSADPSGTGSTESDEEAAKVGLCS